MNQVSHVCPACDALESGAEESKTAPFDNANHDAHKSVEKVEKSATSLLHPATTADVEPNAGELPSVQGDIELTIDSSAALSTPEEYPSDPSESALDPRNDLGGEGTPPSNSLQTVSDKKPSGVPTTK